MSEPFHSQEPQIPEEWIEELQPRLDFRGRKLLAEGGYEELESSILEGLRKRIRLSVISSFIYIGIFLISALGVVFAEGVGSSFMLFIFAGTGLVGGLRDAYDVKWRLETHGMVQAVRRRAVEPESAPASA